MNNETMNNCFLIQMSGVPGSGKSIEYVTEDLTEISRRLRSRTPLRSQFTDIDNLPATIENGVEVMSGEERFRYWMANMKRPDHAYLRLDTSRPLADCLINVFAFLNQSSPM